MSEMATAAKVHKAVSTDPTVLSAPQALRMATRSGAEVLGLGEITGSLEPGKSADMIIASLNKPHLLPLYDIYSHIVYSMKSSDITDVIVQGRVLLEGGQAQSLNEEAIAGKARDWSRKIRP
jgi:5-methylthioadenosine/S-adenosylhomocysteine deaminase